MRFRADRSFGLLSVVIACAPLSSSFTHIEKHRTLGANCTDLEGVAPEHATLQRGLTAMKTGLTSSRRVRYESNGLDFASVFDRCLSRERGCHAARLCPFCPISRLKLFTCSRRRWAPLQTPHSRSS